MADEGPVEGGRAFAAEAVVTRRRGSHRSSIRAPAMPRRRSAPSEALGAGGDHRTVDPLSLVLLHVAESIGPLHLDDLEAGGSQQAIDQPPAPRDERRGQESIVSDADEPGPILGPPQVGRPV